MQKDYNIQLEVENIDHTLKQLSGKTQERIDYLKSLNFTREQLIYLAEKLNCTLPPRKTKDIIINSIVESYNFYEKLQSLKKLHLI